MPEGEKLDGFDPGKSDKAKIMLHKNEEDLDDTLITVSRALHELEQFFMNLGLVTVEKGSLEGWGSLIMENQRR